MAAKAREPRAFTPFTTARTTTPRARRPSSNWPAGSHSGKKNYRAASCLCSFPGRTRIARQAHYVQNPLYPLEDTVAMINLDMVGRLRENELTVYGTGTADQFDALIDKVNETVGLDITKDPSGNGPSDHASFYGKQIPVFHFFTGYHDEYHRPEDDFPLINVPGMKKVADLAEKLAPAIEENPQRPSFHSVGAGQTSESTTPSRPRPYFGSIPDFAPEGEGYALSGVTEGSPASEAGMKSGDKVVQLGESRIGNLEDFDTALRRYNAGDVVSVVVQREVEGEVQKITLEVKLGEPRE